MRSQATKLCGIVLLILCGCAAKRTDYGNYLRHFPKSVLVLPPINESLEVQASGMFLSTITAPLAEQGYYVLPTAVVDAVFKENGVALPPEMHQVPIGKLREIFGADAVMYVTIKRWTTTYVVLNTTTTVVLEYLLVDMESALELWRYQQTFQYSPSSQQNDLISMVVVAGMHAAKSTSGRMEREVATNANYAAFLAPRHGLLTGPRHPKYQEELQRVGLEQEKLEHDRAGAGRG